MKWFHSKLDFGYNIEKEAALILVIYAIYKNHSWKIVFISCYLKSQFEKIHQNITHFKTHWFYNLKYCILF